MGMEWDAGTAYIFQHLHFGSDAFHFGVILGFKRGEYGVGVVAPTTSVRLYPQTDKHRCV